MVKVFGMGNRLLGDDGIGVHLVEALKKEASLPPSISLCCIETDYLYALDDIDPDDFIIIIDSCYFNRPIGQLIYIPLSECDFILRKQGFAHNMTLLMALRLYFPFVKGIFIGIEVSSIAPSLALSPPLQSQFEILYRHIKHFITCYHSLL